MASNDLRYSTSVRSFDLNSLTPDKKESINFIPFMPIPANTNKAELDRWLESTWFIEDDLHHLLSMPLEQFWCQVIFDNSLHKCITGFLRRAPRFEFPLNENKYSRQVEDRLNVLGRQFLLVNLRMSINDEDRDKTIPNHEFGEILYENFIFDLPRLFDFCSLYSCTNKSMVEQIVNNIFTAQPKYFDDVKSVAEVFPMILNSICEKFDLTVGNDKLRRISQNDEQSSKNAIPKDANAEFMSFTYDTFKSMKVFFEVYPPATQPFFQPAILCQISEFYEIFCEHLIEKFGEMKNVSEESSRAFCLTRYSILQMFRQIFYNSTLKIIFENPKHLEDIVEDFLSTIQLVIGEGRFIADYFHFFPIQDDLEVIEQLSLKIDELRLDCIQSAISSAIEFYKPESSAMQEMNFDEDNDSDDENCLGAVGGVGNGEVRGVGNGNSSSDEDYGKLFSVQELLPHLGLGFIKKCLESFDGNTEAVISAILEDNLPPSLICLDSTMTLETLETEKNTECITKMLSLPTRNNIYDGDAFDIFSKDIDLSRVHIGRKPMEKKISNPDESLKDKVKDLAQYVMSDDEEDVTLGGFDVNPLNGKPYQLPCGSSEVTGPQRNKAKISKPDGSLENKVLCMPDVDADGLYQDEYDDTYDDHDLGDVNADSVDELMNVFKTKPLNRSNRRVEQDDDEEDEDEDETTAPAKNHTLFLEDPAVLRERLAQNRAAKYDSKPNYPRKNFVQNKNPGAGAGRNNYNGVGNREATGRHNNGDGNREATGRNNYNGDGNREDQTQDGSQRNPNFRGKSRFSRANHNRRDLAAKKQRF